ncbi:MAG: right-handed parallel beta-helix repeat-containing protein [Lewinellaceae bacterium]|nr:right-handed parallel beta-helix repeat-containing protein [Saprospiraceae bacterium]MCB9340203.1 right-handed parallel beta-helix repeat-containing protein [Lewinellaceae bacterium]
MKKLLTSTFAIVLFVLLGCQKENPQPEQITTTEGPYMAPLVITGEITSRSGCDWTEIPAGSVDALAAAIASACDNGVIYLRAGMHTENAVLTITKPVKIIGETGAVLRIHSELTPPDPTTGAFPVNPALHVLNAPGFLLQDIELQPSGADGGGALLLENSHQSGVMRCKFTNFQYSIAVQKSDRTTIMFNTVVSNGAWQAGGPNAYGITIINGKSAYVSDNDVSNALFGIWACDRWGTAERNNTHGNAVGLILCNVPAALQFPDGFIGGSETPGTSWKVTNNTSTGNFDNGIMIIDGASNNRVWNNQVHGNGLFPLAGTAADIESFDDSHLFGFLTPKAHDNYIDATSDSATTIRNCGVNNTFAGGTAIGGSCR